MNRLVLRLISRAFFLQDLITRVLSLLPAGLQHNFGKYDSLKRAFYMTSLDGTEGDYIEFGVYTGGSMAAAMQFSRKPVFPRKKAMRYFGFDSFAGFGKLIPAEEGHRFFSDEYFETSAEAVKKRLQKKVKDKSRVQIVPGFFDDTLRKHPSEYGIEKAEVVLVDCDTYSGAAPAFDFLAPALQEGTIFVLDDLCFYKGNSSLGVFGAFKKFQDAHPEWTFRYMWSYGCGSAVYIVSK